MITIGLTGGIASGKSTVVSMLRQFGASIIDCDIIARKVVEKGSEGLKAVADAFGPETLFPDGTMNREYIGKVVFSDATRRKALEDILFPLIHQKIDEEKEAISQEKGDAIVFLDMPLLFEVKYNLLVHQSWLIYVRPDVQLKRLMNRNGYSETDAMARIQSQMPIDEKRRLAQVIIDNNGTLEDTQAQVKEAWQALCNQVQTKE